MPMVLKSRGHNLWLVLKSGSLNFIAFLISKNKQPYRFLLMNIKRNKLEELKRAGFSLLLSSKAYV